MRPILAAHLTAFFILVGITPALADTRCTASFEVSAGQEHGTVKTGDILHGEIDLISAKSVWSENKTLSHLSHGTMTVTAKDGSSVSGAMGVVHVVRTPEIADYVSFDAGTIQGDLGGITSYEEPMLVTLYGPPATLETPELPATEEDWSKLGKRMFFQVHTPDTMRTFSGFITAWHATCRPE